RFQFVIQRQIRHDVLHWYIEQHIQQREQAEQMQTLRNESPKIIFFCDHFEKQTALRRKKYQFLRLLALTHIGEQDDAKPVLHVVHAEQSDRLRHRLYLLGESERGGVHVCEQTHADCDVRLNDLCKSIHIEFLRFDLLQELEA